MPPWRSELVEGVLECIVNAKSGVEAVLGAGQKQPLLVTAENKISATNPGWFAVHSIVE